MSDRDYAEIARQYAYDVVENPEKHCRYVRLACQRFLNDLTKSQDPAYPYEFSDHYAAKLCRFIENLVHVEGVKGNPHIHLEPWQVWYLSQVNGWRVRQSARAGMRRFQMSYLEVPRGNGKSALSSGLALYMLSADGEPGAQVWCAATTQNQAEIVFDVAKQMATHPKTARFMRAMGVTSPSKDRLVVQRTFSRMGAVSGDTGDKDGLNIHLAILDELHAHENRKVWDVINSGAGKRDQSLIWAITTAGYILDGIGMEQHDYSVQVLEGSLPEQDEAFLCCIWTMDKGDDWTKPETWRKANPNWDISVKPHKYESEFKQALAIPSKRAEFMTKKLNIWMKDTQQFIDIEALKEAKDTKLTIDDFEGMPCYGALDLGSSSDLTAFNLMFPQEEEVEGEGFAHRKWHYNCFNKYYLTEQAVRESRIAQYRGWVERGLFTVTEGNTTDYSVLYRDIITAMEKYDIRAIAYDPWNSSQLVNELMAAGVPMVKMGQSVGALSGPSKELDRSIRDERFHHNDDILVWMAANTVVRIDTNGNIKPKKENPNSPQKIDGVIAAIMSIAMIIEEEGEEVMNTSPLLFI